MLSNTMSSDLSNVFAIARKQTPKGFSLRVKGRFIYLAVPLGKRTERSTGQLFTLEGIGRAVEVAKEAKEKLDTLDSLDEFNHW